MIAEVERLIGDLGTVQFPGSNVNRGWAYHDCPFVNLKAHRKNINLRVKMILDNYKVKGRKGVDLGCNIGGVTFRLQLAGGRMKGIDYDFQSIAVAEEIEKEQRTGARFEVLNLTPEALRNTIKDYDFVIWFAQWQWFVKEHGFEAGCEALYEIAKHRQVLFFETSMGDGMAGDAMKACDINHKRMREILMNCFYHVVNQGVPNDGWLKRPVYSCFLSLPTKWENILNSYSARVERIGYNKVIKTYKPGDEKYLAREINILKQVESRHFPIIHLVDDKSFTMDYCGRLIEQLPADWKRQAKEILADLRRFGIVHRDIRPDNLLIKEGVIKLIDFTWAGPKNERYEFPPPLGGRFRAPRGFNDKYSLFKSLRELG